MRRTVFVTPYIEYTRDYLHTYIENRDIAPAFIKIGRNMIMTTVSRAGGVDLFPAAA